MITENHQVRRLALSLICASLFVSGCASNQYSAIKNEEKLSVNRKVVFSVDKPAFQVVLDSNDRVLNVFNMRAQSFGAGANPTGETLVLSREQIGLPRYSTPTTRCGYAILPSSTYTTDKQEIRDEGACGSRFYKISNYYWGSRGLYLVLTYGLGGVGTLLLGNVHEKSFDLEALQDAAYNAHLTELQSLLFSSTVQNQNLGVMSSLSIDIDNIDQSYQELTKIPLNVDSVVLLDATTQKPLYVFNFSAFQTNPLPIAVNQQMTEFLSSLVDHAKVEQLTMGVDVKKLIPPEVSLPVLPEPVPQQTKSEYETKAVFNERVKQLVAAREAAIHQLQRQYQLDVYNRNQYIVALGDSWQQYLDEIASEQNALVKKVRKNQTQLARLLYALNYGAFSASDLSFDAESEILYFTANSARYGFKQKMMAKVSAAKAKLIKESGRYSLTPTLAYQDGKVRMDGLVLTETVSGEHFATNYTDINFKPEYVSVRVATSSTKIIEERAAIFKSYQQQVQTLVDTNNQQVWYVETRNSINAKKPTWYTTPAPSQNVMAYGEGNTHEEAMLSARAELAMTIKTTISASTEVLQQNNTFRTYQDATQHARASTDVALTAGDYVVYKQDEMDGKHYVALCYRCNAN